MTFTVTPAELRRDLDALIEKVERGDELHVVANAAPKPVNKPVVLGFDRDRVKVLGPSNEPYTPDPDAGVIRGQNPYVSPEEVEKRLREMGVEFPLPKNRTVIGEYVGKGAILGPIEGPIIPESDWRCMSDELGPEYK